MDMREEWGGVGAMGEAVCSIDSSDREDVKLVHVKDNYVDRIVSCVVKGLLPALVTVYEQDTAGGGKRAFRSEHPLR